MDQILRRFAPQNDSDKREGGQTMDEDARRRVLRQIPYGMYVMTAIERGAPAASTLTWLSQCSFHPPLVMVGIQTNSLMHEAVAKSGAVAVNFLAADQKEIAERFFKPPAVESGRLHGLSYEPGPVTGAPLLVDLPAWLETRVVETVGRGDHEVFVCEVVGAGVRRPDFAPLLLSTTPWQYGG
jgi:flavin reductase (DIM6/NTAB) family NADH-FMN oxidoreductase RutF